MEARVIEEVVNELAGSIEPVGESREDERRYGNLLILIEVMDRLMFRINAVSRYQDRVEASMSKIGIRAQRFMDDLREELKQ